MSPGYGWILSQYSMHAQPIYISSKESFYAQVGMARATLCHTLAMPLDILVSLFEWLKF